MLNINLLPPEYRVADRKPAGAYVMVAVCTILCVSALCCSAYLFFSVLKKAETQRDIAQEQHDNLAPMAKYADELDAENKEFKKRSNIIKEIEATRIHWTKKINQFLEVINNNCDVERHCVWLKELKIRMSESRQPGVDLKGFLVGDQYENLSYFNEDVQKHALFTNHFNSISNPTGSIVEDDDMLPPQAIEFSWNMELKEMGTSK